MSNLASRRGYDIFSRHLTTIRVHMGLDITSVFVSEIVQRARISETCRYNKWLVASG